MRGTPQQIIDKYLSLARDAQLSNDRVAEQAFFQHAEHYTRMLGEAMREQAREQEARQLQSNQHGNGQHGGGDGNRDNGRDNGGREGGNREGGGREGGWRDNNRDNNRDRYEQPRQVREEEGEQPDFAPLVTLIGDDDGPGLVETPEMHHAPQPVTYGAEPAETAKGGERNRRSERGPRGPRKPKAERPAEAPPAESEKDGE